ncbi:MAG: hypothetical protein Q9184_000620 [Pyrenodesmia sp. 2 TL-2023]
MEGKNVMIHLVINIAATMILGMSNTYQQLITSLSTSELKWVLSKHEDSRVGTNSPFNINHKRGGRLQAWLQWLLLIATSLPVHFLANSVIGPSIYYSTPNNITYHRVEDLGGDQRGSYSSSLRNGLLEYEEYGDRACWLAFRTGVYTLSQSRAGEYYDDPRHELYLWSYEAVAVNYTQPCDDYAKKSTVQKMRDKEFNTDLARKKIKTQCLTFGDVIAASAMDSELQVRNECMVNAFDGHRHRVQHTCHPKHCRPGGQPSETGDSIGHCQKCKKFNKVDRAADLPHPSIAIKYKKSLIGNLGGNAVGQMGILMISSCAMFGISLMLAILLGGSAADFKSQCSFTKERMDSDWEDICAKGLTHYLKYAYGHFGGFDTAAPIGELPINSVRSEITAFAVSNGAQLLYSLIYILLIYNFTLITMEHDWGKLETTRDRLRCTIVEGEGFKQSYLLQLPKRVLYPMMGYSALMHWLLGQSISTKETIWSDVSDPAHPNEWSQYNVVYGAYAVWLSTVLMLAQTGICWWAFTYSREGFMPQMYGSIRACCAATTELKHFPRTGIQWGDLGEGKKFRHAGFSSDEVGEIIPAELYCGKDSDDDPSTRLDKEDERVDSGKGTSYPRHHK